MTAVDTTDLRNQIAQRPSGGGGKTVRQTIEEQAPQIARALPKLVDPDRFVRLVLTELSRTPKLQECSSSSLLGALMYAAGLGVEPGPLGHAYLVPFGKEVTFILGYKGMLELARRSGEILDIQARAVYENDAFSFAYGLQDSLEHRPTLGERGPAIAYYAVARFKDGGHYFLVMSVDDVNRIRGRSRAKNAGPWVTDYDAMARKTVIRAMAPYLPLSPEVATAFEQDERVQATFDPDAQDVLTITEQPYDEDPGDVQALSAGADNPPSPSVPEIEAGELEPGGVRLPGQPEDDGNKNDHAVGAREASGSSSPAGSQDSVAVSPAPSVGTGEEAGDAGSMPEPPSEVDPSSVPDVPLDPYDTFTAAELAQECVSRGLSNSGTKTLMIERLREFDQRPM